ncbi:MAG: G3E family GTPase [Parasphingorhabdus sp.]
MKSNLKGIPFTVFGGFLGAGKTTFLNRLLSAENTPRCGILINDFGNIAVDESLIDNRENATLSLKNGCVCCTMSDDLGQSIGTILDLPEPVDHILVEASGVSIPGRIADVAIVSRELSPGGTIVLVDGASILHQLSDKWIADTVISQLQSADVLLVSKLDQLNTEQEISLFQNLVEGFPDVPIEECHSWGWPELLKLENSISTKSKSSAHKLHFHTQTLLSNRSLDRQKLVAWLDNDLSVYRVKGWFKDSESGETLLLQAVGRQVEITPFDKELSHQVQLVIIGTHELPTENELINQFLNPAI